VGNEVRRARASRRMERPSFYAGLSQLTGLAALVT